MVLACCVGVRFVSFWGGRPQLAATPAPHLPPLATGRLRRHAAHGAHGGAAYAMGLSCCAWRPSLPAARDVQKSKREHLHKVKRERDKDREREPHHKDKKARYGGSGGAWD